MKRKLVFLAILIALTISLTTTPPAACAGDECGAANRHSCTEQGLQVLNQCWQTYGEVAGYVMCYGIDLQTYEGCMILKGCASPPPMGN